MMYSSGSSVVWKSSSEEAAVEDAAGSQQRGSATDSEPPAGTDTDGRRLSERGTASSDSSDVVLSSDCSASSEQSPVRQTEPPSTDQSTAEVFEPPDPAPEVVSCENVAVSREPDRAGRSERGSGGLLDEIDSQLRRDRQLLLDSVTAAATSSSGRRHDDDMSLVDIDTALAEVMTGLELLGRSRGLSLDHGSAQPNPAGVSSTSSSPSGRLASPRTPDLVVGLPQFGAAQPAVSPRSAEVGSPPRPAGQLTSAEMFASVDSCTLKKTAPGGAPASEVWTSPGPRAVDRTISVAEPPARFPARSRGSPPARAQSCRAAADDRQTWSALWATSTEIQRDREFVRSVVAPQFVPAGRHPLPAAGPTSPGRDDGVSFDRTELPRFPRRDPMPAVASHSFVACTLPREAASGPSRTELPAVKVKPPVMKKPARSAEMMRRLSEYQHVSPHHQQQLTD